MQPLLEIKDLHIDLKTHRGSTPLVDGLSLHVMPGETFGIVGESGCGKSVTALSVMQLIGYPLYIGGGEIWFDGKNLLTYSKNQMRRVRGQDISMIFQEPMTSLDPLFTVENQLLEVLRIHYKKMPRADMLARITDMLKKVGISRVEQVLSSYPHQLSGGMLQRVMIAMAMICDPKLLIADEPTTALDVTIQAQILALMNDLKENFDTSVVIITHDLGVVAETCQRVAVLYAGQLVEQAGVEEIFHTPRHPYTRGLLQSVTALGKKEKHLYSIKGMVPSMEDVGTGCRFYDRCDFAKDQCQAPQTLAELAPGHICRCVRAKEGEV